MWMLDPRQKWIVNGQTMQNGCKEYEFIQEYYCQRPKKKRDKTNPFLIKRNMSDIFIFF